MLLIGVRARRLPSRRRANRPGRHVPAIVRSFRSPHRRAGIATLWTILLLSVLVLLICLVVEAGRLVLARQQLTSATDSAALAAVKTWSRSATQTGTEGARDAAVQFGWANPVPGSSIQLDENFDPTQQPNENLQCDGDLVFGALSAATGVPILDTAAVSGCGRKDGPNAVALRAISAPGWRTIRIRRRHYNDMVVVATASYDADSPPMVVRIRNATSSSFEFLVQRVNDGTPEAGIAVHFLVVNAGVYTAALHGVTMEVVKRTSESTDHRGSFVGQRQTLTNTYSHPIVVGQVMSFNDPDWSVFWSRGADPQSPVDARHLYVGKHVGEDPDTVRANETIGYLVMEGGPGQMHGLPFLAVATPAAVVGLENASSHLQALPTGSPGGFAIACQSGINEDDGSFALLHGDAAVDSTQVEVAVDEDQLGDPERGHVAEVVHLLVIAGPHVVRARGQVDFPLMFDNLFGVPMPSVTLRSESTAVFDCRADDARLIHLDRIICP